MQELISLTSSIHEFEQLNLSRQVDIFSYFLIKIQKVEGIRPVDIKTCFDFLHTPPYSNIPKYLKDNTKKKKLQLPKYFLKKGKYYLTPTAIIKIEDELLGKAKSLKASNNLYPLEIFEETRDYIKKIAYQASVCYDCGIYDACSVMNRRLLETLIIETFERKGKIEDIKDKDGNFFSLKQLIDILSKDSTINISRNTKQGLAQFKNLGDLSAHSRRYLARKSDIENSKDKLRIVFEELIHIIDYKNYSYIKELI